MELFVKNKKGKVTHLLGVESELVTGIILLAVAALGVLWLYLEQVFTWFGTVLGMPF